MSVASSDFDGSLRLADGAIINSKINSNAEIARTKLALDSNKVYAIAQTEWRVWDSLVALLPATSSADDLGLYPGTWGTNPWLIRSADVKTTTVTLRAACQVRIPAEYVDGETITIRCRCGFITTVCDGAGTIDFEAYALQGTGATVGSDLVTTAATSFKSTTFADKDFAVTSSGLVAGDILQIRMTMAITDTATGTAVIGAVESVKLLADVRG